MLTGNSAIASNLIQKAHGIEFLTLDRTTPSEATPLELKANFRLHGQIERDTFLGFGDMTLSFGAEKGISEIGRIEFNPGNVPVITTGVLSSLNISNVGWNLIDHTFSVPFSLEINQPGSLFVSLETGSVRPIFDFSEQIRWTGSPFPNNPQQGLTLLSVTLNDGTELSTVGLEFGFLLNNTILTAGSSAVDFGRFFESNTATGTEGVVEANPADFRSDPGRARAKILPNGNGLFQLEANPEPFPLVFDLASSSIRGNVLLTETTTNIPEPLTILGTFIVAGLLPLLRKQK